MKVESETKTTQGAGERSVTLLTTAEASGILRISRRTVEELGKKYERAKPEFRSGEPPPSCPKYGLRRTQVTPRKHFYNELDLGEYLFNCRRESDGLEPTRLDSSGRERANERSKAQRQIGCDGASDEKA